MAMLVPTPTYLHYFTKKSDGSANGEYLQRVRLRFNQWILDTTGGNYDQAWLDYQHEISKRHHRVGKNTTDKVDSVDHINYRYMIAFNYPISRTILLFLKNSNASDKELEAMYEAWTKSVLLQTILWTHAYVKDGDF